RYKSPLQRTQMRKIVMRLSVHLIIAGALTFVSTYFIKLPSWQFVVLMIAGIFSVSSCLDYLIFYAKQSMKKAGSGLSHLGFGLLIIGVLGSGLNKRHISSNPLTMRGLLGDETLGKNILLFKNLPMYMNGYEVTYKQDTLNQFYRTYTINYVRKDSTGEVKENFDLHPNVVYDRSMQKIAATNPATHHYWDKDIFTHIAQLPNEQMDEASGKAKEDSLKYKLFFGTVGQKQPLQKGNFEAKKIYFNPIHPDYASQEGDLAIGVDYEFRDTILDTAYVASPVIVLREGMVYNFPAVVNSMGIKVKLSDTIYNSLLGEKNKLELGRFEMQSGDSTTFQDLSVKFSAFVKQPSHPDYKAEKGDVAVGADFEIRQGNGEPVHVNPVYLIRAGAVTDFPVFLTALGAEIRFTGINPEKETVTLELRKWNTSQLDIAADVAQNYSRADFIVLEAILFPGINLFWLGSILMMFGLALSFIDKRKMVRSNG
ncbi:MAG: cytochrome c assembly protein, partial [Saprospiraceae bacterium]